MAEARSALRALIRAVHKNITSVTGNQQWKRHILAMFKAKQGETDPARVQQQLKLAEYYRFLITSVRDHQDLLLSYNIGIDVDEREKSMNRRAANYVGLQMPPKEDHSVQGHAKLQ